MTTLRNKFQRILVPVNGSDLDAEAVQLAAGTAQRTGGELILVSIVVVDRTLPLDADLPEAVSKAEAALDRAERVADRYHVTHTSELLQARATGPAIVDEARSRNADLIVLGISYRKRFGEFYLGQTTPFVLEYAPCRTWVVREKRDAVNPPMDPAMAETA